MNDKYYMRKCFELAKKASGKTLRNPLVGAVLVKNGKILSKGYHHEYGKAHAEVDCFNNLKEDPAGAFLYVNLEPCSHYGNAQTLDGKISSSTNDSKWISNEFSREYVHKLRNDYDAIIVGKNTLIHDNPSLNSRIEEGVDPVRIILDTNLEIEKNYKDYKIFSLDSDKKTYIATCKDSDNPDLNLIKCKMKNNHVDLEDLVNKLYEMNIGSILVEGGSKLNYGFLEEGLVDKIYEFISPKVIGGFNSKSPFYGKGVEKIKDAYECKKIWW